MAPQAVQHLVKVIDDDNKIRLPVDCHYHLCNVCTKHSSEKSCNHVKLELEEDLRDVGFHLRVEVDMVSIIRFVDKSFNLSINYPKGDGDDFKSFMDEFHPDVLLDHVISDNRNRQYILTKFVGPIQQSAPYFMKHLDQHMRACKKGNRLE